MQLALTLFFDELQCDLWAMKHLIVSLILMERLTGICLSDNLISQKRNHLALSIAFPSNVKGNKSILVQVVSYLHLQQVFGKALSWNEDKEKQKYVILMMGGLEEGPVIPLGFYLGKISELDKPWLLGI